MKTIKLSIIIKAPKRKVWNTALDDKTYRYWTEVFVKGSHYVGSFNKGSKILFLAPNDFDILEGVVSQVVENTPYEYLSIKYLGYYKNGKEDYTSDDVKSWAPSYENYRFIEHPQGTELFVEMDVSDDQYDHFSNLWPQALEKMKELIEKYS